MNLGVFPLREVFAIEQGLLTFKRSVVGQNDFLIHLISPGSKSRKIDEKTIVANSGCLKYKKI
jgi:hypothetical protein